MAVTKYKGKSLSLTLGATEFNDNLISVTLSNEAADDDVTTFADLAAGGSVTWSISMEAVSDYSTTSLWGYLWANSGTNVAFVLKPYGNATASATQPHFNGTVALGAKPGIGGEAGETFTFEYTADLTAAPTKAPA